MKLGIKGIRRGSATVTVALTTGALIAGGAFASTAQAAAPRAPYFAKARAAAPKAPSIVAKGGFVMNNGTGKTLFTKAADTRRSTGSTTKIMTARVVLAQKGLNLDSKVTIQKAYSDYIVSKGASSARLI
ncbi:D-alanyl-D-alanine carboxypeptidase, partial [Streptomyces sp. DT225]